MIMENYFSILKSELQKAYAISSEARTRGYDPELEVEVKIASDVAARVEGIVGPKDIAKTIRSMVSGGMAREDVAFEIAKKIASGEVIKASKEQLVEQAVRTGLGILTEGVLVAPTEGISKIKIKTNPDGSDYVAVYYSGPIRSAGGTAVALSVLLADVARRIAGIGDYRATDTQIERYNEEVNMYEARVAHLQYKPSEEEVKWVVRNCPVCIDGDPTEDMEVSVFRGVPGVETNRIRGGIPLVVCEGIAQKAAKVFKYTKKLNLGWVWLEKIIKVSKKEDKVTIKADYTYLEGLVAGRPVFAYPSTPGGFRLRYGRSRTNSIMAKNVHPATMILLNNFLAYGTHMKIERPGKGCVIAGHEMLDPPVVRLKDGSVTSVRTIESAEQLAKDNTVDQILFLGDILITLGDFIKSNYPLLPSAWCAEWFEKEADAKGVKVASFKNAKDAFDFSLQHGLPLSPKFTLNWCDLNKEELGKLAAWLKSSNISIKEDSGVITELKIPYSQQQDSGKIYLEVLLAEHIVVDNSIIMSGDVAHSLLNALGVLTEDNKLDFTKFDSLFEKHDSVLSILSESSGVRIKNKAPTYIGARMGRPEKAKERKMDGSPNVLFPTGSQKNRSLVKVYKTIKGKDAERTVNLELVRLRCTKCNALTFYNLCEVCSSPASLERACVKCNKVTQSDVHCDNKTIIYDKRPVNIISILDNAKKTIGFMPDDVKGVKGLSNAERIPERIEKGLLRAKHDVYVFRDGTSRFDATDIPLTHFYPKEIGVTVEKLKELGYTKDYYGNELKSDDQLVTLFPQDIVLSDNGAEYFSRVSRFLDDALVNLYSVRSFYNLQKKEDLIGHLCAALSPHTSAAVLCRIIGFTKANVGYGHPYFHTAKRRNADGDEDCIMLLLDALINFSRHYLDEKRGGTMDAPLVLTPIIDPKEVDDEAHCIEIVTEYPLDFYHATERFAAPGEVKIRSVKDVLGTPEQFYIPLTHVGGYIDRGNIRTAYVQLESIPDKIKIQFNLHDKIKAVDQKDAAERLILSHFIPDLYGNLRSFSRQSFRCGNCNESYRRVPLAGKCTRCGGNLLLTINKGGIEKYLDITREVIERYNLPDYLSQRMHLLDKEIKSIFEDDKIKQLGLADFI